MHSSVRFGSLWAASCLWLLCAAQARADWYDDIKGVIAQLIQREVAQTLIPNAACRVATVRANLPRTIDAIRTQNFGGLRTILGSEVADVMAYNVLRHLRATESESMKAAFSHANAKSASDSVAFVLEDSAPVSCKNDGDKESTWAVDSLASKEVAACELAQDGLIKDAYCGIAIAVRALMLGEQEHAQAAVRRVYLAQATKWLAAKTGATASAVEGNVREILQRYILGDKPDLPAAKVAMAQLNVGAKLEPLFASLRLDVTSELSLENLEKSHVCNYEKFPLCHSLRLLPLLKHWTDAQSAARRKDRGGSAAKVVGLVFGKLCAGIGCVPPEYSDATKVFLQGLARYVLAGTDESAVGARDAAREALAEAATELLNEVGGSSDSNGFDRRLGRALFVPTPALRYAWSRSYMNEDQRQGARYFASIEWITLRRRIVYYTRTYLAGNLSFVDLLGPFSEFATRSRDLTGTAPWWALLSPRIDLIYGIPSLSRRLAISGGISARAFRVVCEKNDVNCKYKTIKDNLDGAAWTDFFDFALSVRYVL